MRSSLVSCIKEDSSITFPVQLNRSVIPGKYTVWDAEGWLTNWYVSFNGNAKQRRQQRRKLIRELNQ